MTRQQERKLKKKLKKWKDGWVKKEVPLPIFPVPQNRDKLGYK